MIKAFGVKGIGIKPLGVLIALVLLLLSAPASAEGWFPLQVALWQPAQAVPEDWNICGLRLNLIYGKNTEVWGLDMGFANTSTKGVYGIQAGLLNGPGTLGGIGLGAVNSTEAVKGLQAGLINVSEKDTSGAQVSALYNQSRTVRGLQIGLINAAENIKGVQIGLINRVKDGALPFLPIINPGF